MEGTHGRPFEEVNKGHIIIRKGLGSQSKIGVLIPMVLKAWSLNQQLQPHPRTDYICKLSGPTPSYQIWTFGVGPSNQYLTSPQVILMLTEKRCPKLWKATEDFYKECDAYKVVSLED